MILLYVFRCLDGMAPLYLANMLKRQCSTGRTRSSQQHMLEVPRTKRVSLGDRSFKVIGPRLWNSLPIAVAYRCSNSLLKHICLKQNTADILFYFDILLRNSYFMYLRMIVRMLIL